MHMIIRMRWRVSQYIHARNLCIYIHTCILQIQIYSYTYKYTNLNVDQRMGHDITYINTYIFMFNVYMICVSVGRVSILLFVLQVGGI